MAIRYTTPAGNTAFIKIASQADKQPGEKRKTKKNPTIEAVEKVNQRNAEKELTLLLNENAKEGDYHLVLTHAEEPDAETAERLLDNFLERLRRLYAKMGVTFLWILSTEYENKRIHHHLFMPGGVPLQDIEKKWGNGYVYPRLLDGSGNYRKLAAYLIKETSKTFRNEDAISRRRYRCSRNIKRPVTRKETVSNAALFKDPEPPKGYYIDQDTLYRGENPFSGKSYIEYMIIKIDPEERHRWRGRKTKAPTECFDTWLTKHRDRQQQMQLCPEEITG